MGDQEGEDGYDVIEQLAKLPWCNGSVGMAGNSHLAIIQWHIAAKYVWRRGGYLIARYTDLLLFSPDVPFPFPL